MGKLIVKALDGFGYLLLVSATLVMVISILLQVFFRYVMNSPLYWSEEIARYAFANQIRDAAIWAYKSSEYVGEEVLAYLPVPGEYIGCGDLNELTGGKDWSI